MRFSDDEIQAARHLKALGLAWEPCVGNYVLDANHSVQPPSPFQDNVYFVLNYDHFMRLLGGVEQFKEQMVWLPTWEDLRTLLNHHGIDDCKVIDHLSAGNRIENRTERLALYELLIKQLDTAGSSGDSNG